MIQSFVDSDKTHRALSAGAAFLFDLADDLVAARIVAFHHGGLDAGDAAAVSIAAFVANSRGDDARGLRLGIELNDIAAFHDPTGGVVAQGSGGRG